VVRIYPKDDATQSDKSSSDLLEDAKKIRSFFNNDYISVYQVDRGIAEKAAEISREYNLTPPDAIHIATAIKRPCLHLQTYDGEQNRRGKLLRFHNKIGYPLLQIIKPQWPLPGMPQSLLLE
jgi:predicted nucleic acid-binding protein